MSDPWPAPERKPAPTTVLCAHCGKSIYWRQPTARLQLAGGWKHSLTGFAACGFGATTTATPRED